MLKGYEVAAGPAGLAGLAEVDGAAGRRFAKEVEGIVMRTLILGCSLAVCAAGMPVAGIAPAQDSAPSSHFVFDDDFPGDILVHEVRVPSRGLTRFTYYEVLGWRGPAAGYAGIQDHPRGRNFIFSIWDHPKHRAPITAVFTDPGTQTERFGGEGTGLKSWNFELGWSTDRWITLVARAWDHGEATQFGYWVRTGDPQRWTHLVTMEVAVPRTRFEGPTDAFLEDWARTGLHRREVHYRNGWKRALEGTWVPLTEGRYSVNRWDLEPGKRSFNFRHSWNGGIAEDAGGEYFFMIAGGTETRPEVSNPSVHRLGAPPRDGAGPGFDPLRIVRATATRKGATVEVRWEVDAGASPQFTGQVDLLQKAADEAPAVATSAPLQPHDRTCEIDMPEQNDGKMLFARICLRGLFDDEESPVCQIVPVVQ